MLWTATDCVPTQIAETFGWNKPYFGGFCRCPFAGLGAAGKNRCSLDHQWCSRLYSSPQVSSGWRKQSTTAAPGFVICTTPRMCTACAGPQSCVRCCFNSNAFFGVPSWNHDGRFCFVWGFLKGFSRHNPDATHMLTSPAELTTGRALWRREDMRSSRSHPTPLAAILWPGVAPPAVPLHTNNSIFLSSTVSCVPGR